jgi:hypothetical protein
VGARQEYPSVDAALRTFSWWPEVNLSVIRDNVADLDIKTIYTPPGRSYIGLVVNGASSIVAINFGFIWGLRDEEGKKYWVPLPINRIHDGGYTQGTSSDPDPCPNCGILLPASGLCDCA